MALLLKALASPGGRFMGERTILSGAPFTIGRGAENDWVLNDPERHVSNLHCRIDVAPDGAELTDLSSNGVFFEGDDGPVGRGTRRHLGVGDVFKIGDFQFIVSSEAEAQAEQPATPLSISEILDGGEDAREARLLQNVTGDAPRWLGNVPSGVAGAWLTQPLAWSEPPSTQSSVPPVVEPSDTSAELANTSEHVAATGTVLRLPRAQHILPVDWNSEGGKGGSGTYETYADPSPSRGSSIASLRQGAGLPPGALEAAFPDDVLAQAGGLLAKLVEGVKRMESVADVIERDLGLGVISDPRPKTEIGQEEGQIDLALLLDPAGNGVDIVSCRLASLAGRFATLGEAVREGASELGAELRPATIEQRTRVARRVPMPFSRHAACWRIYGLLHRSLTSSSDADPAGLVLGPIRRAFANALAGRAKSEGRSDSQSDWRGPSDDARSQPMEQQP